MNRQRLDSLLDAWRSRASMLRAYADPNCARLWDLAANELDEALRRYQDLTGEEMVASLDWCLAFNLFRLAAILQGVAGRVKTGNAASPRALAAQGRVAPLAETAWFFARRAGAPA